MAFIYFVVTVNQVTIDECFSTREWNFVLPSDSIRICLKRNRLLQSIHDPDLLVPSQLDNRGGGNRVFQYYIIRPVHGTFLNQLFHA